MSGGTVIAGGITVGMAATAAGTAASLASGINNAVNSGQGGSGGGSGSGGGGMNVTQTQYAYYGPHASTTPMAGEKSAPPKTLPADKAIGAQPASAARTPTQGAAQNAASAKSDYQNQWADRLSKYLDYNTRNLG